VTAASARIVAAVSATTRFKNVGPNYTLLLITGVEHLTVEYETKK